MSATDFDTGATPSTDADSLTAQARETLARAVAWLFARQHADGHWCAELEGDSILQSEYILLKWILGQEQDDRLPKIAACLRRQQQPDGTWVQYPGAGMDISATVKGYFALKLMGDASDAEHMRKAREAIRAGGGAERCNSFTKFYLACLGQIAWSAQPSIPPEIVFLPRWSYFHIDKLSAWTRTMILPLAIVTTYRPTRHLQPDQGIGELYLNATYRRKLMATQDRPHPFWSRFFLVADRGLKGLHSLGLTPWRKRAVKWIEDWLQRHLVKSDGLGAIFPPMVYIQIAFRCLGYPDEHPLLVKARSDLDDLMLHDKATDEIRIQPCTSPVWDTGIASFALTEAGLDREHEGMARAGDWLLGKECRFKGDWAVNIAPDVAQHVEPAGWFFEYNNAFYPDVDDTAMVSMALKRIGGDQATAAARRGVAWNLAMQNDDGGWAAFDRGAQNRPILDQVPFADHNAMQDPSCPDITGRVFESLGWHGYTVSDPAVQRGIEHIRAHQQPDGCWFGRWGVNYIYGTFEVLCGLHTVHADMSQDWVQKAGQWLRDHQHADGSFGESPDTYEDPSLRGQGPSTASQTAWGVMGMMAVYGHDDAAVQRGIRWLCQTQTDEDTWDEPWFTGTGFPRVFYLRYHYYRHYFPIMAIGRWLRLRGALPEMSAVAPPSDITLGHRCIRLDGARVQ